MTSLLQYLSILTACFRNPSLTSLNNDINFYANQNYSNIIKRFKIIQFLSFQHWGHGVRSILLQEFCIVLYCPTPSTAGQGKKDSPKGKTYSGIGVINLLLRQTDIIETQTPECSRQYSYNGKKITNYMPTSKQINKLRSNHIRGTYHGKKNCCRYVMLHVTTLPQSNATGPRDHGLQPSNHAPKQTFPLDRLVISGYRMES